VSVTITCTKKDGTTITAQASGEGPVTWSLLVIQEGGLQVTIPPMSTSSNNGVYTATWSNVPNGTYKVTASSGNRMDTQPVPFGNYT
jgi:hypothetical protein